MIDIWLERCSVEDFQAHQYELRHMLILDYPSFPASHKHILYTGKMAKSTNSSSHPSRHFHIPPTRSEHTHTLLKHTGIELCKMVELNPIFIASNGLVCICTDMWDSFN